MSAHTPEAKLLEALDLIDDLRVSLLVVSNRLDSYQRIYDQEIIATARALIDKATTT